MKPHGGCFTLSSVSHFENIYSYRNKSWKNNTCSALCSYQVNNSLYAIWKLPVYVRGVCLWTADWSAVSRSAFSKTLVFTQCLLPSFVADITTVGAEGVIPEFHNLHLHREAYTLWFGADGMSPRPLDLFPEWREIEGVILPARITRSKWYYFLNISYSVMCNTADYLSNPIQSKTKGGIANTDMRPILRYR